MNPPAPDDDALLHRVASLPPPVLRAAARQRSLAAALAAAAEAASPREQPEAGGPEVHPTPAPRRRRFPRLSRLHLTGLAACWAVIGYFHLSAPGAPVNPGTSPAAGYTAWPGPFHPAPDEETARMLATLYPGGGWGGGWAERGIEREGEVGAR